MKKFKYNRTFALIAFGLMMLGWFLSLLEVSFWLVPIIIGGLFALSIAFIGKFSNGGKPK